METLNVTIYDELIQNMKNAGRRDHLHRIVYIFEYFKHDENFELQEVFNNMIAEVNSDYCDEPITGMLIYYEHLGINMIEGSEDVLLKHLQNVYDSNLLDKNLGRMKILLILTHIKQRFFNRWLHLKAQPQTLLDKIDPFGKKDEVHRQLKMIVEMLYRSWNYLRIKTAGLTKPVVSVKDLLTDRLVTFLPQTMRLEFALATPVLRDFSEYVKSLFVIKETRLYQETVWPLPSIYIQYSLMSKKGDTDKTSNNQKLSISTHTSKKSTDRLSTFY